MDVCHKHRVIDQNLVDRAGCDTAEYKQTEEGYDIKNRAKHAPFSLNKIHSC